jgi:CrcB protein
MFNINHLLLLALGGALGTSARYVVFILADRHLAKGFPYGTLIVNILGSFLIGLLWGFFSKTHVPPAVRMFVFIGILGSFTTFSAFAFDNMNLLHDRAFITLFINILLNNLLAIGLCIFGYYLARM